MGRYREFALFCTLAAVWGASFMAIKAGLGTPSAPGGFHETPVTFAALRYDIAGVVMVVYAVLVVDDPVPRGRRQWAAVTVGSLLLIAAYHAFLFVGETDPAVTSAAAAVIVALNPILTTGFSRVLLPDEKLTRLGLVGLGLGLVGAVVLARPDPTDLLAGGVVAKLLIGVAVLSFSFGSVVTERLESGMRIETMEAWSMVGGAAVLHVAGMAAGEQLDAIRWTDGAIWSLAYLAIPASAVGFLIYFALLDRLGSVEINLVSYAVPPFAAVSGWLVLGETPTVTTGVGFLLIFAGFAVLKRRALAEELGRMRGRASTAGE